MDCRPGCGACCIAPSISPSFPALPEGKPAGVVCPHLDEARRCRLFGKPERPATCVGLRPGPEMCGASADEAMSTLLAWEALTTPRTGR
jgi:Fe-S-cluster containining protein